MTRSSAIADKSRDACTIGVGLEFNAHSTQSTSFRRRASQPITSDTDKQNSRPTGKYTN